MTSTGDLGNLEIRLATADDDAALRALYRDIGMADDGPFSLSYSREPSFFDGLDVEGRFTQVCVCSAAGARELQASFTRGTRPLWTNDEVREIGYLGGLRIRPAYRGGALLARGFRELRRLHDDGRCPFYISTILEGNSAAIRALGGGRMGLPAYHDIGRYICNVMLLRRKPTRGGPAVCERGSRDDLGEIVDCLNRNGAQKQFAPVWRIEDFTPGNPLTRGFAVEDFHLLRRSGRIAGVLGTWDQSGYKQITVESYSRPMRLLRAFWNGISALSGHPRLPAIGQEIPILYGAFLAVDDNDPEVFRELLSATLSSRAGSGYLCCILGLHERDPLLPIAAKMRQFKYCSRAYVVSWEDGEDAVARLDDRIPYMEAALL